MDKYQDTQEIIDLIVKGDTAAIIEGITAYPEVIRLNALIYGTKLRVNNTKFTAQIKDIADNSDTRFFGMPFRSFAIAALDVLDVEKYTGEDKFVHKLIRSGFDIV